MIDELAKVKIFLGNPAESFVIAVPPESISACYALPRSADRIAYWANVSGDERFYDDAGNLKSGTMVWSTAP